MTKKEHKYWCGAWLRTAASRVEEKDWLGASNAYLSAAHHAAVLAALKQAKA
jgi:hypothetical protein